MLRAAASAIRVTTTHVVSSNEWVSRTTINDRAIAMVVRDRRGSLWLTSAAQVLAPDLDTIRHKVEQQGGPPAHQSHVTLTSVVLDWPRENPDSPIIEPVALRMPKVVLDPFGEVAVIALPALEALATAFGRDGTPSPTDLDNLGSTSLPEATRLRVSSLFNAEDGVPWTMTRWTTLASASTGGFAGRAGVVALDLRLTKKDQGAPVMEDSDTNPRCVGLTVQLHGCQAGMVLAERIPRAIHYAAGQPTPTLVPSTKVNSSAATQGVQL